MKKIKVAFLALLTVLVGVFFNSCEKEGAGSGKQGPHLEMGPKNFKNAIDWRIKNGENYVIVDYRSKAQYEAGHVPGSIWIMEGTIENMDDGQLANTILKDYCHNDKKYYVFLVGGSSTGLQMTMGGSVSDAGFGKNHSIVLAGGFKVWKDKNAIDPENFPIEVKDKD